MPIISIVDNNIEQALKECRKLFVEVKRIKSRYEYYLRPALKLREKRKMAAMKRKYY